MSKDLYSFWPRKGYLLMIPSYNLSYSIPSLSLRTMYVVSFGGSAEVPCAWRVCGELKSWTSASKQPCRVLAWLCQHTNSDRTSTNRSLMYLLDHPTTCTRDRRRAVSTLHFCLQAVSFALTNDSTLLANGPCISDVPSDGTSIPNWRNILPP